MAELERVIKGLECCVIRNPEDKPRCEECPYYQDYCLHFLKRDALKLLKAKDTNVPAKWRRFEFREPDAEEKAHHPDWVYVLIGGPDDGDEILVTNGRYVWKDEFIVDDECYLDSGHELEGCWWMPLPEPPKEEEDVD